MQAQPLGEPEYGSDALARYLRDLGFEYIALNPGASYRGLHDSLVNYLGNESPKILLCLHEEHAVAIAHGYAKVTGRPMLTALHTNVGLMHASMAIFNAWCDRVPVVVLGSNGPVDAARRRPWIDWLHTTSDQAAPVRQFVKWDDEPQSVEAAAESLVRATALARQLPAGPTYVAFDAGMQERVLEGQQLPEVRPLEVHDPVPDTAGLEELAGRLASATRPVLVLGRLAAAEAAWKARVEFAERFGARVITDLRVGATFPTHHPLHVGPPGLALNLPAREALRTADVVVGLGAVDLAGALRQGGTPELPDREIVAITADPYVHNGWSKDHQGLPAGARYLLGDPDKAVAWMLAHAAPAAGAAPAIEPLRAAPTPSGVPAASAGELPIRAVAYVVHETLGGARTTFVRLPIGWPGEVVRFEGPLDFLGGDGGAGVGSGPGLAVGAALGLRDTDRLAVAIIGDGDFLMGCTALWTAAKERLGLLVVVSNNRSYFNDELHQERVARERGRPVENRWVGQRIEDPAVDLLAIARAQGAVGYGPVDDLDRLGPTLTEAAARARAGEVVVVDVSVRSEYDAGATSTINP